MKKLLSLLFAFQILFTAEAVLAEAAEEPVFSGVLAEETAEARTYADKLQERFGVTILFGSECLNAADTVSFAIEAEIPGRITLQDILGFNTVSDLEILEKALEQYPLEVFSAMKNEQAPNGFRFLICDRIVNNYPEQGSVGYASCDGTYYNIFLAHSSYDPFAVHHEIWHEMENYICWKYPGAFLIWDSLNPENFEYSNSYSSYGSGYDPSFFAREYGTSGASEDRATIAEAVFYSNREEWFSRRPGVRKKLEAMNLALISTMGIQFNWKNNP